MYKVTHHVEDYFMPINFGRHSNYGMHKVDCNKIICVFFTEDGKPRWELFTCDQIMEMVGYVLPRNKNKTYLRMKFQSYLIMTINWLCEEHVLNIVQIKISEKRRVCYGFTKELQDQADNIDRKIEARDKQISRVKNRKQISNQKSLKLIKNEKDQCLEHLAVI